MTKCTLQYKLTNQEITITDGDARYHFDKSHLAFGDITNALLEEDYAKAIELGKNGINVDANAIKKLTDTDTGNQDWIPGGSVIMKGNTIWYNGKQVEGTIVERIKTRSRMGLDYFPLLNFLKRLVNNPDGGIVRRVYSYVEYKDFPIANDGCFFAYKAIDKRLNSGAVSYVTTGQGIVIGTYDEEVTKVDEYYKLAIVKVDPCHIITVPLFQVTNDLKVSQYEIVADAPQKQNVTINAATIEDSEQDICNSCLQMLYDCNCQICPECDATEEDCECDWVADS